MILSKAVAVLTLLVEIINTLLWGECQPRRPTLPQFAFDFYHRFVKFFNSLPQGGYLTFERYL